MRGEEERVDKPTVQRITLDQMQFQSMLADLTRQLRSHAEQIYAQVIPYDEHNAGAAVGVVAAREAGRKMQERHAQPGRTMQEQNDAAKDLDDDRPQRLNNRRPQYEDNLGSLKLWIPEFQGKTNPDTYLEWEQKMEAVFRCQRFAKERKVMLATTEFEGYAVIWWQNLAHNRS